MILLANQLRMFEMEPSAQHGRSPPSPHERSRASAKGNRIMPQTGVVKFFNMDKGYGFIKPEDGGRDIFVHVTAVEQAGLTTLNEGQRISYEIEMDKKGKGPKAVQLQVLA
jgi:cold shock protein